MCDTRLLFLPPSLFFMITTEEIQRQKKQVERQMRDAQEKERRLLREQVFNIDHEIDGLRVERSKVNSELRKLS